MLVDRPRRRIDPSVRRVALSRDRPIHPPPAPISKVAWTDRAPFAVEIQLDLNDSSNAVVPDEVTLRDGAAGKA